MTASILLVDDEAPIARVLSTALRGRGHSIVVTGTALEALDAIASAPPDVLLLDVNLPDLTGWELLRRLDPAARSAMRIIVFSASPLAPSRVEEFRPDGVLTKPFPIDALFRLVDELVPPVDGTEKEQAHA